MQNITTRYNPYLICATLTPHNDAPQTHRLRLPFTEILQRTTPWNREITAPRTAATSVDSRRSSVASSWW